MKSLNVFFLSFFLIMFSVNHAKAQETLREYADSIHFHIGTAVHRNFFSASEDDPYVQLLKSEFNTVVAENVMKPEFLEPVRGKFTFGLADQLVRFAEQNNMKVRGHCLVWHKQIPKWMNNDSLSREQMLKILKNYITTVVSHFKGKIMTWDVLNEAIDVKEKNNLRKTVWLKTIGPDYIDSVFVWAHRADPSAKLFYNDYDAEGMNKKSNAVYQLVKNLKKKGIPINGVGLQCHFHLGEIDFNGIKQNMQRLAKLGLQTQITECDISMPLHQETKENLDKQAKAYGKLLNICLHNKNCTAFMVWGFTDRYSWIPRFSNNTRGHALLFDKNYKKKPAFFEVLDVLKNASKSLKEN